MKIYHITNDIAEASGVGTFVRRISGELNALGVESHVLTEVPETLEEAVLPDIVHIHGMWLGMHHAAFRWAKLAGCKVVWSTHGMTAPWSMHHKWWKKLPAWLIYQKHDLKSADLIHCTTDLEEGWNKALGLKKTFIAPLGTDLPTGRGPSPFAPAIGDKTNGALERDCGRPGRPPLPRTLLYVGRIYPVKALDNLIRAFALAVKEYSRVEHGERVDWVLRIVGPDEAGHMSELITLCDQLHLTYTTPENSPCSPRSPWLNNLSPSTPLHGQIQFPGPKFDADLSAEYENCTALALVSHTENFGATVVDALAHAKPVITSTNTPWKIVLGNSAIPHSSFLIPNSSPGRCGWWVDNSPESLSKTLLELFSTSTSNINLMGQNGRALVEERYTWPAVARTMLSTYQSLLS